MQLEKGIDNKMSILHKIPIMKNFYTSILLLLITSNYTFSQTSLSEEAIKNSEYVFEGVVLDFTFVQDTNDGYFVSYKLNVKNLLKETKDISINDTVELVSPLPDKWRILNNGELLTLNLDKPLSSLKGLHLSLNTLGVFVTKKNTSNVSEEKNSISLMPYCMSSDCFFQVTPIEKYDSKKHKKFTTYIIEGFDKSFHSKDEFNDFLKKMNLNLLVDESKKKDAEYLERRISNDLQYAERVKTAKEYQKYLDGRLQNLPVFRPKAIENITYEILNESVTGTGTQFYEFDIFVSGSTSNTFFDNSAFVIEFNTFAFGINLSANNLVTITRGANFNNSTYIDPMTSVTDDAPNAIRFGIGSDFSGTSWNRTLLTTTPEKLLHVKIELDVCNGFSDIAFIDIPNVSNVAIYTTTPNIDPISAPYLAYDNPDYIQPDPFEFCPAPMINSFTPLIITSGTNSILTINGVGFGNNRGNGQVKFLDARLGGTTSIDYLNSMDYLSWTDSEIKIVLPYVVDTLNNLYYPGSGLFRVKRDDGLEAISPSSINVKYANINNSVGTLGTSNHRKSPSRHVDLTNLSNGIAREFYLDTSIANNPEMAAIVRKSLKNWSCATTINWTIADTIMQQGLVMDGKSIIYLDDSYNGSQLGVTSSDGPKLCVDAVSNEEFIYWTETDIAFTRSFASLGTDWFFDTTMMLDVPNNLFDFYSTVVHELGHAHYLGHINDQNDIMYYGEGTGFTPFSSRYHLFSSQSTIEGGTFVMSSSEALNTTNCDTVASISPIFLNFCGDLSVPNYTLNSNSVLVYPNPFIDEIKLNFEMNTDSNFSYIVTDLYGKLISKKSTSSLSNGNHTEIIELPLLSSGVYFVTINLNNERKTIKIVKQ
jgi:hypothetical protein